MIELFGGKVRYRFSWRLSIQIRWAIKYFFLPRIEATQRMKKCQKTRNEFQTCPPAGAISCKNKISKTKPLAYHQPQWCLEFEDCELEFI
jgi:hypothetical protein